MSLRKSLLGISGIILTVSMAAFGQQTQTTTTTQEGTLKQERLERREKLRGQLEGMRRHSGRERMGRRGPGLRDAIRGVDLTEAQRAQIRSITQRRLEATKSQRDELSKLREKRIAGTFSAEDGARAKALHEEIRTAMEGVRAETAAVLTSEQKARIEQRQKERKANREQRMKERQELRNKVQ
ncbi:MAG TPA: Spy/CpxP family protein refolding chaperone [Pyrinomonadaceae bacterium]|nr:Spy/CpxP family protein refolding chaperone [Pyrinomonadaceae bacterium]